MIIILSVVDLLQSLYDDIVLTHKDVICKMCSVKNECQNKYRPRYLTSLTATTRLLPIKRGLIKWSDGYIDGIPTVICICTKKERV